MQRSLKQHLAKGCIKLVQLKYADKPNPDLDVLHTVRVDLAQSYSRIEGKEDAAAQVLRTLLEDPFANGGVDEWRMIEARSLLGVALIYIFKYEEAEPLIKSALRDTKRVYGEDSSKVLDALGHLGQLYAGTNRRLESAQTFGEMRKFACKKYGDDHIRCAAYMANEGINYIDVGDYGLATNKLRDAMPTIRKVLGVGSPFDQASSFHLASALMEIGQTEEAGQLIEGLEIDKLTAGAPGAPWDLLLGALQTRLELRSKYSEEANARLKSIIRNMEAHGLEDTLIARASGDLRP